MGTAEFDKWGRLRKVEVWVEGRSAEENAALYDTTFEATMRHARAVRRSPWVSGSFYLVVVVTVLAVLLVVTRVAPPWAIFPVLVGGVLLLAVVGGFQLRQDDRLSEKNFLALMALALGKLPALVRNGRAGTVITAERVEPANDPGNEGNEHSGPGA
ncbi:hypothetical protein [Nocardia altamirensis]|uniref:hypothetical protein n=1 Tax=Nocardia altamirensis TaxID=472158 RepID=UPI0008409251|nr:hypothetical protein [Nocardia altamirensis]